MAPVLGYWDLRGLVMPIKYVLEYAGAEYEDKTYKVENREAWTTDKANLLNSGMPFANLPYFIDGDVKLSQSLAILRYVAKKHGLAGSNDAEAALLDVIACQIWDLRVAMGNLFYRTLSEETKKEFLTTTLPNTMGLFEKFLAGKDFALGKSVSYADFFLWETVDHLLYFSPEFLKDYPNIKAFYDRVAALPKMKEYLASDKCFKFPLNGPIAKWGGKMEDIKTRYPEKA